MNKSEKIRSHLLIGVAIVAVSLTATFFFIYLFSEQNRDIAVKQLKSRTAAVEERYLTPGLPVSSSAKRPVPDPAEAGDKLPVVADQDAIRAFEKFTERMGSIQSEAALKEVLELIRKANWDAWTEAEQHLVREFLDANRELLDELHVLVERSGPLWVLDFAEGFNLKLYHLAGVRDATNMLTANIAMAVKQENHDETVRSVMTIVKLANRLSEEPILISQLVGIAINDILSRNIAQLVHGENLPPEQFARIIGAMRDFGGTGSLEDAFAMEGLYGLKAFEGVRMGDWNPAGMSPQGAEVFLMRFYGSALARPFLNLDERRYADIMNRMSDIAALPFYEANQAAEQLTEEIANLPRTRFLSRVLLPATARVTEAQARGEARMGLMQIGLAVEQYQGRHGVYPDSLAAIAPMLNGAVPLDPYTGKPFVYEPRPDGFTLYSARGSAISPNERSHPQDADAQGNIVWRGSRQ